MFVGGGGGSGDNLPLNISVNDVPDGINGQMFIEVVRIDQIGETIVKTFQFGEVTPIQNKHMDFLVEGMNNGDNAFIYAQYEDENGEIINKKVTLCMVKFYLMLQFSSLPPFLDSK